MTAATGNTRRSTLRILIGSGLFHVRRILPAVAALGAALALPPLAAAQPLTNPSYTREQAAQGKTAYPLACATCHGANLDDGEFAPPLKGVAFRQRWGRQSVEAIFTYIGTKMPPARPGSLGDATTAALVAYLLQEDALQPGASELPADPVALRAMLFPSSSPNAGNGLTAGVTLPPPPGAPIRWTRSRRSPTRCSPACP